MGSVALTSQDSLLIGQTGLTPRVLSDLADGDTLVLEYPNNSVEAKPGKNNNVIFAFNSTGILVNATLRLIRGSADDKYFNALFNDFLVNRPSFRLLNGTFVKQVGDGQGNITSDTYRLNGGVIQRFPDAKENVEGDLEQAVAIWRMVFSNVPRALT